MNKKKEKREDKQSKLELKNFPFLYPLLNSGYTYTCMTNNLPHFFRRKIGQVFSPLLAGQQEQLPVSASAIEYLDCALPTAVLHRAVEISYTSYTCCCWHFQHELLLQRAHGSLIIHFSTHGTCGTHSAASPITILHST